MEGRKSAAVAAASLDKKMPADSQGRWVWVGGWVCMHLSFFIISLVLHPYPHTHTHTTDQTVEEYLKAHCNQLVEDLNSHAEGLIQNLQQELEKGKAEIMALAQENSGGECVCVCVYECMCVGVCICGLLRITQTSLTPP
jgi:hypothetical protein